MHMHIGSGTDMEHLSQVASAVEQASLEIGSSIRSISAGGGLPIPYAPGDTYVDIAEYFELWQSTRTRLEQQFGNQVSLEIEPGRYLTAESGYLISEIRAVGSGQEERYRRALNIRVGDGDPGVDRTTDLRIEAAG